VLNQQPIGSPKKVILRKPTRESYRTFLRRSYHKKQSLQENTQLTIFIGSKRWKKVPPMGCYAQIRGALLNMLYPLIKERSQPLKLLFFHN